MINIIKYLLKELIAVARAVALLRSLPTQLIQLITQPSLLTLLFQLIRVRGPLALIYKASKIKIRIKIIIIIILANRLLVVNLIYPLLIYPLRPRYITFRRRKVRRIHLPRLHLVFKCLPNKNQYVYPFFRIFSS